MGDEEKHEEGRSGDARPAGVINAESALRLVLVLLALWTVLSGLALTFFQDASDATIGGGLKGGQGAAAQRLLGVHLLVLAPLYGLLAWEPKRYRLIQWVPFAAQGGVVAATLYDIMTGDRDFQNGALPLVVAATFFVLLVYVWWAGRQPPPTPVGADLRVRPGARAPEPAPEPDPRPVEPAESAEPGTG